MAPVGAHVGMVGKRFQTRLDRCHRRLELMVDIVSQFTLDAYLVVFLLEGKAVLAVKLGHRLAKPSVKPDNISGYFAELVVGK